MRVTSSTPATPLGLGGVIVTEVTVAVQNTLKLSYFTSSLLCVYLMIDCHYLFSDMYLGYWVKRQIPCFNLSHTHSDIFI